MKKDKITIVIPVYNTEKYLGECLDSLLCQTYEDLYLICVNDGSTDASLSILNAYKEKDPRITVYSVSNGGAASARNYGIERFMEDKDSNYITFVDSDDTVEKDFIECLYSTLKQYDADVSTCDWKRFGNNDTGSRETQVYTSRETLYHYFKDEVYTESPVHRLFRKKTFETFRFLDGKHYEDTFISYRLIESFGRIAHISYRAYNVRVREESLTNSHFTDDSYDKIEAGLEIYEHFKGTEFEKLAYNKYLGILFYFIIKTNSRKKDVSKNSVAINDVKKIVKENGFKDAKPIFWPFIFATKLNLISLIRYE